MTQVQLANPGIDADIRAFVDAAHAQQIDFLRELVKVPSDNPSGDCAPHATRAKALLEALGLTVEAHAVPQAQDVTAGERVGEGATLDQGGSVGPVDPPDQRLEFVEHHAGLGQQGRGVLGRRLTFLVARASGHP